MDQEPTKGSVGGGPDEDRVDCGQRPRNQLLLPQHQAGWHRRLRAQRASRRGRYQGLYHPSLDHLSTVQANHPVAPVVAATPTAAQLLGETGQSALRVAPLTTRNAKVGRPSPPTGMGRPTSWNTFPPKPPHSRTQESCCWEWADGRPPKHGVDAWADKRKPSGCASTLGGGLRKVFAFSRKRTRERDTGPARCQTALFRGAPVDRSGEQTGQLEEGQG
jgi:hypothetical protein